MKLKHSLYTLLQGMALIVFLFGLVFVGNVMLKSVGDEPDAYTHPIVLAIIGVITLATVWVLWIWHRKYRKYNFLLMHGISPDDALYDLYTSEPPSFSDMFKNPRDTMMLIYAEKDGIITFIEKSYYGNEVTNTFTLPANKVAKCFVRPMRQANTKPYAREYLLRIEGLSSLLSSDIKTRNHIPRYGIKRDDFNNLVPRPVISINSDTDSSNLKRIIIKNWHQKFNFPLTRFDSKDYRTTMTDEQRSDYWSAVR